MSKFIQVRDDDTNDCMLLNIDNIVSITEGAYGNAIVNLSDRRTVTLYEYYDEIKDRLDYERSLNFHFLK